MQLNLDDNNAVMDEDMELRQPTDTDEPEIDATEDLDLGDETYDYAKSQKLKKYAVTALAATMGLVLVALIVATMALTSQKRANKEIKAWVADYITEKLDEAGISKDGIKGITDDLNYLLADTLGTGDLDFSQLTEDQVKDLIRQINTVLHMLPEEERNKIAYELIGGYTSKVTGTEISADTYEELVKRLNEIEYNNSQLERTISTLATGTKGEKGDRGEKGATGAQGPQGIAGQQGAQGPQGIQGQRGEKGEKGEIGATGATGAQGIQGVAGLTAYELAQQSGLTRKPDGTQMSLKEWLDSLKGKDAFEDAQQSGIIPAGMTLEEETSLWLTTIDIITPLSEYAEILEILLLSIDINGFDESYKQVLIDAFRDAKMINY